MKDSRAALRLRRSRFKESTGAPGLEALGLKLQAPNGSRQETSHAAAVAAVPACCLRNSRMRSISGKMMAVESFSLT